MTPAVQPPAKPAPLGIYADAATAQELFAPGLLPGVAPVDRAALAAKWLQICDDLEAHAVSAQHVLLQRTP